MKKSHKKKHSNTFFWFMGLMGKRLPIYFISIIVSTVGLAGVKVANSYLAKTVINAAQTRNMDQIGRSVFINFLAIVIAILVWRAGIIHYNIEGKCGIAKLEKLVFSKAMRLPMSYYETHHSGDFMSKLIFDTGRAGEIYGSRFRRITDAIISSIVYLIPMFYFNTTLTLCLLLLSIVSFITNTLFMKPMKKRGMELSKQNSSMTEKLMNILAGVEVTKMFPVGDIIDQEYETENENLFQTQKKTNHLNAGLECFNMMFDLLGALAFLGLGIVFVSYGWVNLGELTAIYTLYGSFRFSFLQIGRYLPQMINYVANAERVRDFLDMEEEQKSWGEDNLYVQGNESVSQLSNEEQNDNEMISIKNLSFSYTDDKKIIEDFSLDVMKGTSVAITGKSGRGKSTLAKILLGFYKPSSGDIKICGKNYKDISLTEVRNYIGYVPQEPYLYNVSIADNIAFGKQGVTKKKPTMDEIIKAAKAANAHDFIMKLPNGYDTITGERGNQLSGGEKQRIAIARAIIKNAPVLLMDEATSALDHESEMLVNDAINKLCENRTAIIIAHRQSTIDMADYVCEM